uniref:Uncharacterized protein n=1 Tax=Oryza meridionalis TaxID=40149 RepID=A0A0E0DPE9_9ORYZ
MIACGASLPLHRRSLCRLTSPSPLTAPDSVSTAARLGSSGSATGGAPGPRQPHRAAASPGRLGDGVQQRRRLAAPAFPSPLTAPASSPLTATAPASSPLTACRAGLRLRRCRTIRRRRRLSSPLSTPSQRRCPDPSSRPDGGAQQPCSSRRGRSMRMAAGRRWGRAEAASTRSVRARQQLASQQPRAREHGGVLAQDWDNGSPKSDEQHMLPYGEWFATSQ